MTTTGIMLADVHQLGSNLKLRKGQRAKLVYARNLPQGGWFASPISGEWGEDNSIHVTHDDVLIDPDGPNFPIKRIYPNGEPIPEGACMMVDHHQTTLTITFRTSRDIGIETLRDHLQKRYEVIDIVPVQTTIVGLTT